MEAVKSKAITNCIYYLGGSFPNAPTKTIDMLLIGNMMLFEGGFITENQYLKTRRKITDTAIYQRGKDSCQ